MSKLHGIPDEKILHERTLSDGTVIYKVANGKGEGDFRVIVVDAQTRRRLTPSHGHYAIDLYGKLCADPDKTQQLFVAIERVFQGTPAESVIKALQDGTLAELATLPGYSAEHVLCTLEAIFEQENVNWDRDLAGQPQPEVRKTWVRQQFITSEEAKKGSAIAIVLLRRVVRHGVHPVSALPEVGLGIFPVSRRKGGHR